jgi:Xaa-Pro dipeptidase
LGEGNILSLFHDVDVPLKPGMVFHVPVALREWGQFTVAVSETVLVTEGAARPLGKLKREITRV